jgi:prevent-host-death family protein
MKSTYSVSRAQARFPKLLKEAEHHIIAITRHEERVAYIVSKEQLESLIETLEIMSNPKAVKSMRDAQAGRTKYYPLPKDLDDEG